jgi:hypothetical protein
MRIELDHVFLCTAPGAPEAERLVQFGLQEGPPNQHVGQGTANRRFSFFNAKIELLWVSDAQLAQSARTRPTFLSERWSGRNHGASPFGICVRPFDSEDLRLPFRGWEYRPEYLPNPLFMHIGDAGTEEPMWVYLNFLRRAQRQRHFRGHPAGVREITGLTLTTPAQLLSEAAQRVIESGILATRIGERHLLEIEFDCNSQHKHEDFRPELPLIFRM